MIKKISYIFLILDILVLTIKYKIYKNTLSFEAFINHKNTSKKKLNNLNLEINQIVNITNRLYDFLNIKSCLIRSMVLKESLSKRGYHSNLIIGIKNDMGSFESHCWLKIQNKLVTHNINISKFKVIMEV